MAYIKRNLENKFTTYLSSKEIIAVIGPRQAGKTTMINNVLDKIQGKKIKKVTFEEIFVLDLFEHNIDEFIKKYILGEDILFIDEVQYSQNCGKRLKYIFDTQKIKIIISGSSAIDISVKGLKYLVGRVFILELQTLSFEEFLQFKDKKLLTIYKTGNYSNIILKQINNYIIKYVVFGGYPRVVIEQNEKIKIEILKNIYNTYLLREIKDIIDYKDSFKINKLIQILSFQIGNIINQNDISQKSGIPINEISGIINVLEKSYVCKMIKPFYKNKRNEIIKSPKIFFFDLGLRNIVSQEFNSEKIKNSGEIIENFICCEFLKMGVTPNFWRKKSQAEVDFVLEKSDKIIGVEVKTTINNQSLGKGFLSFLNEYKPSSSYVLSFNFEIKREFENSLIQFLPFSKFFVKIQDEMKLV
jgi:uncharacterized protein